MHLPLSFPEFPVQAEGSLLGKARRMCPASSLDTTVGLGPPVPHWADDHGLLSSPPVPPPPWLPEQQSIHGLPCSHLPYSLGLHTGPAGPASMQLANHICTCSPSPQLLSVLQVFARPGLAVEGLSPGSAWQTCICSQVASSEILPAASLTELGPPSSMLWKHFWQGECGKVGRIQTGRPALPHTMWPLVNK